MVRVYYGSKTIESIRVWTIGLSTTSSLSRQHQQQLPFRWSTRTQGELHASEFMDCRSKHEIETFLFLVVSKSTTRLKVAFGDGCATWLDSFFLGFALNCHTVPSSNYWVETYWSCHSLWSLDHRLAFSFDSHCSWTQLPITFFVSTSWVEVFSDIS